MKSKPTKFNAINVINNNQLINNTEPSKTTGWTKAKIICSVLTSIAALVALPYTIKKYYFDTQTIPSSKSPATGNVSSGNNMSPQTIGDGSGNGNIYGNGNNQNVSNVTNIKTDDHSTLSPKIIDSPISNSSNVNFGNSEKNSHNSFSNGSGKVFIGGGADNSTIINTSNIFVFQTPSQNHPNLTSLPSIPTTPHDPQPGGDWPAFDQTYRIEMTDSLPKAGVTYIYEFYQAVEQGDRLRFFITPVNGAEMKTKVSVLPDGSHSHEISKIVTGQNILETKRIAGQRVKVQISSWNLGLLDVRVEKAN